MYHNKISEQNLTISAMSNKFDVTARTLRFYESIELLFPIRKRQQRFFTRRDQARLKLILEGKRFGFSLEEIRQLLNLYHVGDQQTTQLETTYKLAGKKLSLMKKQQKELSNTIIDLTIMIKAMEKTLKEKDVFT